MIAPLTMNHSRRQFLQTSTAYAAGFCGLRAVIHPTLEQRAMAASGTEAILSSASSNVGYGALVADPKGMLDLPAGFSYKVISQTGQQMADGLLVAGAPDGMATFAGPDGLTILVRNHETTPTADGPFGAKGKVESARYGKLRSDQIYDDGEGKTPSTGGTTTLVYDTEKQELVRQFQSLVGTVRNCAGGPTPWGSWITCEETTDRPGFIDARDNEFVLTKSHGYNFEVPATAEVGLANPIPLKAMGRFRHEAIAVDPVSGAIYQTEDIDNGVIYRFLPNEPGKNGKSANLTAGGKLQALMVVGKKSHDTRNWDEKLVDVGDKFQVSWVDLNDVESPEDDLRFQAFNKGAARFARAEGMWYAWPELSSSIQGEIYFACTSGGVQQLGQIWKYTPSSIEGEPGESDEPGKLELFLESADSNLIENADNLTVAPSRDLVVCEDRWGEVVRLIGVTPEGSCYTLAHNHVKGEFAGPTFSPDGTTLFVNLQTVGKTVAITGPWKS